MWGLEFWFRSIRFRVLELENAVLGFIGFRKFRVRLVFYRPTSFSTAWVGMLHEQVQCSFPFPKTSPLRNILLGNLAASADLAGRI